MTPELDDAYKLADAEATYLLTSPAPLNGGSGYKMMVLFARALVLVVREARRLSLFNVLYDQVALAADCKCEDFKDCEHLADAFSVYEATKAEMARIALARTEKPKKTLRDILTDKPKPDLKGPVIESIINPETIH